MQLTPAQVERRLKEWMRHHPCDEDTLWHVHNALGDLLDWPEWYTKLIEKMEER